MLAGGAAEGGDRERQSLPGLRLVELAARLEPTDTVPVEYRRGTERRTASVVTDDEPAMFVRDGDHFAFTFRGPQAVGEARVVPSPDLMERLEVAGPRWQFLSGSPLGRLELAPLNPDLGALLRHQEGVLVISAPKDSALGLKGGDVVLRSMAGSRPARRTSSASCGATTRGKLQAGHLAGPEEARR